MPTASFFNIPVLPLTRTSVEYVVAPLLLTAAAAVPDGRCKIFPELSTILVMPPVIV